MRSSSLRILAIVSCLAPTFAPGQLVLTTTYLGTQFSFGAMFDIEASGGHDVVIDSFDVHIWQVGGVAVYRTANEASHAGQESNPAMWTHMANSVPGLSPSGLHNPTSLTLDLQYLIPSGRRVGFYLRVGSAPSIVMTPGTQVGVPYVSGNFLTVYEGIGLVGFFNPNPGPYVFNGTVRYHLARPALTVTQTPQQQDLHAELVSVPATAVEGYTLVTTQTWLPVDQGPLFGIIPEPLTWSVLGIPYAPGNPFHFRTTDPGLFPDAPFVLPPGGAAGLSGMTLDFVCLLLRANQAFDSASTVARWTFQ